MIALNLKVLTETVLNLVEICMKNWKLILWAIIGLIALLTLPLLYTLVAIQLDPEPDSFDRPGELGQLTQTLQGRET